MAEPTTATTSLAELKRQTSAPEANLPAVTVGFDSLQGWTLMQRVANALASSSLVPSQYQGNIPNCIIALEMSHRLRASPLMVMQNLYVVYGRPGWSSQFLIASFNQCGRFTSIRYQWHGKPGEDAWGCRAGATEKATGEELWGPLVTVKMAKDEGWYDRKSKQGGVASKWPTMTELMLTYRAAAFFVRTYAPEISMGLPSREELDDMQPVDAAYTVSVADIASGTNGAPKTEDPAASQRQAPSPEPSGDKDAADAAFDSKAEIDALYALAQKRRIDPDNMNEFVGKILDGKDLTPEGRDEILKWIDQNTAKSLV